jgi:hypothetical protein
MINDPKTSRSRDMAKLRKRMDGDDGFMSGHQIKKIRTREREIPAWTLNDEEVRKVLLRAFPKLHTQYRDGKLAARWARIIHLYFRMQMSNSQAAKDMEMTTNAFKKAIQHIRRVARGRSSNNSGLLRARPEGRPNRNS